MSQTPAPRNELPRNEMPRNEMQVGEDEAGRRLDNFLYRHLRIPRAARYRLIRKGAVRVDGRRRAPDHRLQQGERVSWPQLDEGDGQAAARKAVPFSAEELAAMVLHAGARHLVLDKPAGMAVHAGSGGAGGLIERLRASALPLSSLAGAQGQGGRGKRRRKEPEPGEQGESGEGPPGLADAELGHRLDKPTSGCLAVFLRRDELQHFQNQLRRRGVDKVYLAVACGRWEGGARTLQGKLPGWEHAHAASAGREASCEVRPLALGAGVSLLQLRPQTGRTHQLRIQLAAAGHPILGDHRYGDRSRNAELLGGGGKGAQGKEGAGGKGKGGKEGAVGKGGKAGAHLLLHAWELSFALSDGARVQVRAPLPQAFRGALRDLGLRMPPKAAEA